ncbi:MAG TPA: 2,3-bisphosphoglycerate-independent phosphoglycerate mutase [Gemmatimonadaceae bacterium]|nr:2,3-bisphosphoglycerate-independent phosphoglycerate mutase [Gemmatimonadaceae bacterium]
MHRPVALVVLDGWGHREAREGNAIAMARTPAWDALWSLPSRTLLEASGLRVGLPQGQMGNSEVGHLNLGAGRVVMQDLVRINASIADGSFFTNPAFVAACEQVKKTGGTLHLFGLVGCGGVHALDKHLFALIDLADRAGVKRVAIHAMLDGRDTMPASGLGYLDELLAHARDRAFVASIGGRYYGMDRDRRWERTQLMYRASVLGAGPAVSDPRDAVLASYGAGLSDEFMLPVVVSDHGAPKAPMRDGDAVIFFNYRSDRMRQIVRPLIEDDFDGFDPAPRPRISVTTMTGYDPRFSVPVAYGPQSMARIVVEVLAERGKSILKTAETEKYPHVTYFFNGGNEPPVSGEERVLIPSPRVATYDLKPEMSASGVADALCGAIDRKAHDFLLCNFANADMVGHSGSIPATIRAVEAVDACLGRIVQACDRTGTRLIVTADHGNAELMLDPATGGPHTAHTTNPVPLVLYGGEPRPLRSGGALCDVGPTLMAMMGMEKPEEMTGADLREID